jgi:hypothetical protein
MAEQRDSIAMWPHAALLSNDKSQTRLRLSAFKQPNSVLPIFRACAAALMQPTAAALRFTSECVPDRKRRCVKEGKGHERRKA